MIETIKYMVIWLFIFVVGSLIVSFIIYPSEFESFKSNVKTISAKVIDNVKPLDVSDSQANTFSCEDKLQEDMKVFEVKNPEKEIKSIEKESFNNLEDTLEYVKNWDVDNTKNSINYLKNNFNDSERIDIVLIQMKGKYCFMDNYCDEFVTESSLQFGICKGEEVRYPVIPSLFQ